MQCSLFYNRGFTIVELLIVIVIIGILAVIVIVSYNGITGRAKQAALQSASSQASKAIEFYKVSNADESYPLNISTINLPSTTDISYLYTVNNTVSPKTYCLTAMNGTSGYYVSNTTSNPTSGACPLTNLSINPSAEVNTTTFVGQTGATISRVTTEAYSGSASIQVITPGSSAAEGVLASVSVSNMAGRAFSTGVWVKAPAGTVLYTLTRTSGAAASDSSKNIFTATGSWQFIKTENKIAQSDAALLQIHIRTEASPQARTFYIDAVMMVEGPYAPGYFDGASSGWVWNGTAQNSTSTGPPL